MDQFLNDTISSKFQGLKTGLMYIKSQPNLEEPVESIVLVNQTMLSSQATNPRKLFQYNQLIPTMIGTFMLSINLDYAFDLRFLVKLREIRSLDMSALFEARLSVDVRLGYGIAYLLEFGLYVKGNVLRTEVEAIVEATNIIPVQLINSIAQIPEINQ